MKRTPIRILISAGMSMLMTLSACTMEPTYRRPEAPVTRDWPDAPTLSSADSSPANDPPAASTPAANAAPTSPAPATASPAPAAASLAPPGTGQATAPDIGWREFFTDPRLQNLIELALQHNPDARIATLNIAAARSQYQIQRASLFPSIAATGVEQVEKYPAAVSGIAEAGAVGGSGTTAAVGGGGSGVFRYFDAGIGFTSYELDVFGRIRSLNHQKLQQYLGYVETRRSTQISLVAEVADAYLTVLADRELLQISQDTLGSQQDSLKLVTLSFDGGVATGLDLHQAETTVATARANIAQYARQVAQDENALVLLIGTPLPAELTPDGKLDDQKMLADFPAGLPSDLLTQRPDILAAEHNLIAANASIGAARAAFFPRITLTGNYGTASLQLSGLFDHGSTAWTFSPQISLPIFAGGANVASLDLAKVQKNIYVVQYEQAIQTAFREVADALAGRGTLDAQIAADQSLVHATTESYRLSDMRYRGGVDNYLGVLDSQRLLFSAQQSLIQIKLARLQNLVTLYKALGGGWREHGAPNTAANAQASTP